MKDIHQVILGACQAGANQVVAVVLECEGSTPRKAGAKALIEADGSIHGTIGGGAVEAEAQRRASAVLQTQRPVVFEFKLQGDRVPAANPICGGQMRVLLHPVSTAHLTGYAAAAAAQQRRERGLLLTWMRDFAIETVGKEASVEADKCGAAPPMDIRVQFVAEPELSAMTVFPPPAALIAVLKREVPTLLVGDDPSQAQTQAVFVEPVLPKPVLLIVGGGHVGQAVASLGSEVGFEVMVLDDRAEFTRRELFPEGATTRCGDVVQELARLSITPETYVVMVTRGHQHDAAALAACLDQPAAYLGMIGSRRKVALLREEFIASGRATVASFARVHAPIGLDIGAVTVPEIALSIVAELIATRRKRG